MYTSMDNNFDVIVSSSLWSAANFWSNEGHLCLSIRDYGLGSLLHLH